MAASNWNAISNENNRENVTVVKVDVHHRFSQVTQTVDSKKALNTAPAKQKKLKHTKTKTKAARMKEVRNRKKNHNQTSVYSSMYYQNDNLNNSLAIALPRQDMNAIWSELDDNMPCVKICVKSTNDCPSGQDDLTAGNLSNSHDVAPGQQARIARIPCIKIRIESTSNTSSIVHHQDIILHGDNFNSLRIIALPGQDINVTRSKTAAERMREIIAMKKNRIKSNRKSVAKGDASKADAVLKSHELVGPSQEITPCSKPRVETMQEYGEKKKRKVESEIVQ